MRLNESIVLCEFVLFKSALTVGTYDPLYLGKSSPPGVVLATPDPAGENACVLPLDMKSGMTAGPAFEA